MDAEVKWKWVKALRSGKYQQTMYYLKNGDAYCCLGVLAEAVLGQQLENEMGSGTANDSCYSLIREHLPLLFPFTAMNDVKRYSFAQIADYIEANL